MVRRQQAADRAVRPKLRSPGHPKYPRHVEAAFWTEIAKGLLAEEAAAVIGVAQAVGARWFRHVGGMPPFDSEASPRAGTCRFSEREEIALLKAQGKGVREIAREIGRDPGTISRELRRNAATRSGKLEYRASVAQWKADMAARRPKTAKLVANPRLHAYVQERLSGQISRPGRHRRRRAGDRRVDRAEQAPPQGPAVGSRRGARSRSRTGSNSTSPMMSPCASATRRSTRHSISRAAAR